MSSYSERSASNFSTLRQAYTEQPGPGTHRLERSLEREDLAYMTSSDSDDSPPSFAPSCESDLSQLLHDTEFSDAEILVEPIGSLSRELFNVHKAILAARSPVLRHVFRQLPQSMPRLLITDIAVFIVQAVLQYIYTDSVDLYPWDRADIQELFTTADKFELHGLRKLCESRLIEELHSTCAFELLEFAVDHHAPRLQDKASQFINTEVFGCQTTRDERPAPIRADLAEILWKAALTTMRK